MVQEHLKAPPPIHTHQSIIDHSKSVEDFNILGRDGHNFGRTIKESFYIGVNNSTLNMNIHKYNLQNTWDRVLFTTLELKIKNQQEQEEPQAHNTTIVPSTPRNTVNISCRADEAILLRWQKFVTQIKLFCLFRTYVHFYIKS